jgi:hypothetical protein
MLCLYCQNGKFIPKLGYGFRDFEKLRVINYVLLITSYELRITSYELRVTNYEFGG